MDPFRDFLPTPQVCKSIFQSALGFSLAQGGASLRFVLFTRFSTRCEDTFSVVSIVFMRVLSLSSSSGCRCGQSQPSNPFENSPEQLSRNRHFRHLEDDLPGMAHDLRPDLDQFLPQRRQCPVTHRLRQHRLPQEVAQVVGQHEQLQPHLVGRVDTTMEANPSAP